MLTINTFILNLQVDLLFLLKLKRPVIRHCCWIFKQGWITVYVDINIIFYKFVFQPTYYRTNTRLTFLQENNEHTTSLSTWIRKDIPLHTQSFWHLPDLTPTDGMHTLGGQKSPWSAIGCQTICSFNLQLILKFYRGGNLNLQRTSKSNLYHIIINFLQCLFIMTWGGWYATTSLTQFLCHTFS